MMGFAQLSVFGGYSIYFPELFPTRLRGTGVGSSMQYAVEVRNRQWFTAELAYLLRSHNVSMVLVDQAWMPHADQVADAHGLKRCFPVGVPVLIGHGRLRQPGPVFVGQLFDPCGQLGSVLRFRQISLQVIFLLQEAVEGQVGQLRQQQFLLFGRQLKTQEQVITHRLLSYWHAGC